MHMIHVYVAPSTVQFAGEDLFARRHIKKGSLVAVFNGARKRHFRLASDEFSDYRIEVDSNLSLDIPEFYIPVKHYSATLGHKVRLTSLSFFTEDYVRRHATHLIQIPSLADLNIQDLEQSWQCLLNKTLRRMRRYLCAMVMGWLHLQLGTEISGYNT